MTVKNSGMECNNGMSTEETSFEACKFTVKNINFAEELIFHSNRGVQYVSGNLQKPLNLTV